jgi:hypothetical protein
VTKKATTRRTTQHATGARSAPQMTLGQWAAAIGGVIRVIGGVEAACVLGKTDEVWLAFIVLPGHGPGGARRYGTVRTVRSDGSRWICQADNAGWFEHEFPAAEEAIAALLDPARCRQMREFAELVRQLQELTWKVRDFPPVEGAMPNFWQERGWR